MTKYYQCHIYLSWQTSLKSPPSAFAYPDFTFQISMMIEWSDNNGIYIIKLFLSVFRMQWWWDGRPGSPFRKSSALCPSASTLCWVVRCLRHLKVLTLLAASLKPWRCSLKTRLVPEWSQCLSLVVALCTQKLWHPESFHADCIWHAFLVISLVTLSYPQSTTASFTKCPTQRTFLLRLWMKTALISSMKCTRKTDLSAMLNLFSSLPACSFKRYFQCVFRKANGSCWNFWIIFVQMQKNTPVSIGGKTVNC